MPEGHRHRCVDVYERFRRPDEVHLHGADGDAELSEPNCDMAEATTGFPATAVDVLLQNRGDHLIAEDEGGNRTSTSGSATRSRC